MKHTSVKALIAVTALFFAAGGLSAQGMMGGYSGQGNGYGMMGQGYGPGGHGGLGGYGMMGNFGGPGTNNPQSLGLDRISLNDAKSDAASYIKGWNNPNLVIDEAMEFDRNFYVLVKEKDTGRSAFELLVDPYTGAVGPEPGPNMMWNAKYGPMSGQFSSVAMTVSVAQARALAQKYLDQVQPGYTVEQQPDEFYGYYTAHILKDGKIKGMLSVNGSTGQVWFHSWHGPFRTMEM